jgi:DNA-directed RNA polymerase subunit N (RpoN/RPB10)
MIIPVRCFGCGKVLADKWDAYVARCRAAGEDDDALVPGRPKANATSVPAAGASAARKGAAVVGGAAAVQAPPRTVRGRVLDELGITSSCCRTVMLTNVDLSHLI